MASRADLDACKEEDTEVLVWVENNGKRFGIINPDALPIAKFQTDGCVFGAADGKKCDFLFELNEAEREYALYVELKGTNLNEAYKQLVETLKKLAKIHAAFDKKCFIVCAETPRLNTTGQKLERKMNLDRKVLLKIRTTQMCVERTGNVTDCP